MDPVGGRRSRVRLELNTLQADVEFSRAAQDPVELEAPLGPRLGHPVSGLLAPLNGNAGQGSTARIQNDAFLGDVGDDIQGDDGVAFDTDLFLNAASVVRIEADLIETREDGQHRVA